MRVLEAMQIHHNNITGHALGKLDEIKEKELTKKTKEVHHRRQILRGMRKRHQDHLEETEEPSYAPGAFDVCDDPGRPGPSGLSKAKKQTSKRKSQSTHQAVKGKGKKPKIIFYDDDYDDHDDHDGATIHDNDTTPADSQPPRKSSRTRKEVHKFSIEDYDLSDN
jgi:hypothetical protein